MGHESMDALELVERAILVEKSSKPKTSSRSREVRARTVSMRLYPKRELEVGRTEYPERVKRIKTRGECVGGPRPCPLVGCAHNLYLDVSKKTGAIKLNFPDLEVEEMTESCSLDVADRGGITLESVGQILNVTRERIRQIEEKALSRPHVREVLRDFVEDGVSIKRRLPVVQDEDELGDDEVVLELEESDQQPEGEGDSPYLNQLPIRSEPIHEESDEHDERCDGYEDHSRSLAPVDEKEKR